MAGNKGAIKYVSMKKFFSALGLLCFFITVVAGFHTGARPQIIVERSLVVLFAVIVVNYAILRTWASWEQLKDKTRR